METIENEFKNYLNALLAKIPKPENGTLVAPNSLNYGQLTRDFNKKASAKLDELSTKVRNQPEEWQVLSDILTEYRTKLMTGSF